MIYLEYPPELELPQREIGEEEGCFEFGEQVFMLHYCCKEFGHEHSVVFAFERLQPHDDGPRKI
jgi:hypothetical protein